MRSEDTVMLEDWWKKYGLVKGARFNAVLTLCCLDTLQNHFRGGACLELGCAAGIWTKELSKHFEKVVAVDGDAELIEEARNRVKADNLEIVHSLFKKYDPDGGFDTIIMAHILEHVDDPVQILSRARNWLNDSGVILGSVPNANSIHRQAGVKMGLLQRTNELNEVDKRIGHKSIYDQQSLRQDIEAAGLKASKMGGVFLKFLTNVQIEEWFTNEMIEAFYRLGDEYPEIAAETYAVCKK